MATLLNQCGECIEFVYDECTDIVIAPDSGITANTTYWWFITDQFGNIYKHSVLSTADGVISISPDHLPAGFLTSAIGQVTIAVRDDEHATTDTTLVWGDVDYTCILASFQYSTEISGYYE